MSELKQLKQLTPLEAANVGGGEGDCTTTANVGTGGVGVSGDPTSIGGALIGTYEGIIEATSYAIERVINAVSSDGSRFPERSSGNP